MTTITVETRLPFDHLLRTLHQLSQAELAQLADYVATLQADSAPKVNDFQAQLEAMANDPDIQREMALIETEFAVTEMDGLELFSGD